MDACHHFDEPTQERRDKPSALRPIPGDEFDDFDAAFQKMSIRPDDKIEIVSRGVLVPQSSLIELGSKGARGVELEGIDWKEYFPQLFLSQTPHHYLGVHEKGYFRRIDMRAMKDSVLSAQQRIQQPEFDKLHALLQKIKALVVTHGEDARLSLVYRVQTKKLEVFSRKTPGTALPDKWLDRFRSPRETKDEDPASQSSLPVTEPDDSEPGKRNTDESDDEEKGFAYDGDGSFDSLDSDRT